MNAHPANPLQDSFQDDYALLGIPPGASEETIKSAYRKHAKQCHPDVNTADTADAADTAFRELSEAFKRLIEVKGGLPHPDPAPNTDTDNQTDHQADSPAAPPPLRERDAGTSSHRHRARRLHRRSKLWRLGYVAIGFVAAGALYPIVRPIDAHTPTPIQVISEGLTIFSGPGTNYPVVARLAQIDDTHFNAQGRYGYVAVAAPTGTHFIPLKLVLEDTTDAPLPPSQPAPDDPTRSSPQAQEPPR